MTIDQDKAVPVRAISSMAVRQVLSELACAYEQRFGCRVQVESVGGVDAARRVLDGDPFDIVVLAADAIDRLARAGRLDPGEHIELARSGIAVAVRAGARHPDIGTQAALRETLLAARSIGYSTGPSGAHVLALFERLEIAQALAPRIVQAPPGVPVGALIERGEVELGFQQLSELIDLPRVDVVGPLPPGTQHMTTFCAAVCAVSKRKEQAEALLAFLASPAAAPAIRRYGMDPINS